MRYTHRLSIPGGGIENARRWAFLGGCNKSYLLPDTPAPQEAARV